MTASTGPITYSRGGARLVFAPVPVSRLQAVMDAWVLANPPTPDQVAAAREGDQRLEKWELEQKLARAAAAKERK